jgi:AcrR family transcriptional regulator
MSDSKKAIERPDSNIHKQKRALLTRQELLRSARVIFARDGFEHARLEDIASNAGKTRGAFYDNFKDKEDVFCAIFEEDMERDLVTLGPLLRALPTIDQRIEALSNYLSELANDRQRILLNLEFKLYAIRHPRKRKRLADLHTTMRLRSSIPELDRLLREVTGQAEYAGFKDSMAICGIMDGLSLNHLFDPDSFNHKELVRYLNLCIHETVHCVSEHAV